MAINSVPDLKAVQSRCDSIRLPITPIANIIGKLVLNMAQRWPKDGHFRGVFSRDSGIEANDICDR